MNNFIYKILPSFFFKGLHKKICFVISIWILTVNTGFASGRIPETIIKVGIIAGKKRVHIKCDEKFKAIDISSADTVKLRPNRDYLVMPLENGLKIGKHKLGKEVRFVSYKGVGLIRINGRRYRDTIMVRNNNGTLTVINELGLDGYLFGVLPVEVSPVWPSESLKAQAIISRTYVLNNLGKYKNKGYDLSSDIFSQMYRGVEVEDISTNKAVQETAGMVLTYKGSLAKAYFFSSCGGYTENVKNVWGNDIPYMKGVTCHYCKDSPRYHWKKQVSAQVIKQKLISKGHKVGDIKKIKFLSRTKSGRINRMYIIHSEGKLKITGHNFRMAVGPDIIKSAMMAIDRAKSRFYFYGRGWGHGIGMCQWGAKGMAERGKDYRQILRLYFPKTKVKKWNY